MHSAKLLSCWDLHPEASEMRELNQKKVEALKEKWVASIMMLNEEYSDARKKLLSAKQLYPELDNIDLSLTICDILLLASAVRLSCNENDFHCILDLLYPSATYSSATCYFDKLVTSINGVKDEFPGAEEALEVVQNALNMLLDREKNFHHGIRHDSDLNTLIEISSSTSERCRDILDPDAEQSSLEDCTEVDQEGPQQELNHFEADDFAPGQVWAIYCGKDLMPRQYAAVNRVVSKSLISVTILEPVFIDKNKWREDLPVACGIFIHGNSNVILVISQFSHLVKYVAGTTMPQHYVIYPQKGEIWAMYKNWNREWEHTEYEKCQCWMVEVVSDFSEENGMQVVKLEEVHDYLTFFCRQQHKGFDMFRTISETDMLSFSHQILAYRVPGIESYGIPEDSWHLEPHAIPLQQQV